MLKLSFIHVFLGITIGAAAPKVVWLENKLNGVTLNPTCSSLRTPETIPIPGQPTGIRSPEVPGIRFRRPIRYRHLGHSPPSKPRPFLLLLLRHRTLRRRRRRSHRKPAI